MRSGNRVNNKIFMLQVVFILFLAIPLPVYAAGSGLSNPAGQALAASLPQPAVNPPETNGQIMMGKLKGFTRSFKSNGGYLDLGFRFGYMDGFTSFDFNHHVSELEYPFNCYLGGGNINLGYKDLSLNSEFWGSLVNDPTAGWNMKDKDWERASGQLESDTRSHSNMNAVIWDANLRYDFFKYSFESKKSKKAESKEVAVEEAEGAKKKPVNIKLGALIGYRYQRYGFKVDGMYQTCTEAEGEPSGSSILEYKVKYQLPYYGLAVEAGGEKLGVSLGAKYAFSPHIRDLDNHVLRSLDFYGDYKKKPNVLLTDFMVFWKFCKNWQLNTGADIALIRMDGRVWDDTHDPDWDHDQSIDTKQFIYWLGLNYRF